MEALIKLASHYGHDTKLTGKARQKLLELFSKWDKGITKRGHNYYVQHEGKTYRIGEVLLHTDIEGIAIYFKIEPPYWLFEAIIDSKKLKQLKRHLPSVLL